MAIRRFRMFDVVEIPSLIRRAIIERDNHNYTREQIDSSASYYTAERFCEDLEHKIVYVSTDNEKITGTATLRNDEVMACFILPEYQGRGLGREFVGALERDAVLKGFSNVWLVAVLSAVEFYEKLGYHKTGEKMHRDWGKGIIMGKYVRKD
ncbi:MAG: GNAT family N-acetyltransferase [Nanoarchaeota archaeon]